MGLSARFTNDTLTYYRQHQNNTVGINKEDEDENELIHILTVKVLHYREMRQYSFKYNSLYESAIKLNNENLIDYRKKINFPFWWEKLNLRNEK
jgi:hypothetical protein